MANKILSLREAAQLVPTGALLGVGGCMDQMVPVSFLLELARSGARDLRMVTVATGLSIDILLAGGCVSELFCAIVSYEDFGMSSVFRRRVESGELRFREYSELTIITRLTAAMHGVPFLVTRGALGTDIVTGEPDALRVIACPFTGVPVLACAALVPDVSVIHVHRADALGNAQLEHKHIWHDAVIARAARRVIVTAEEIVSTDEIRKHPEDTFLPSFVVDAVVEAPRGAAPSTCTATYQVDRAACEAWVHACKEDASMQALLARWIDQRLGSGSRVGGDLA